MVTATAHLLTTADLAALPEDGTRHDLVEGELVEVSRPKYRHGRVQGRLGALVGHFIYTHNLGDAITEAGFILDHNPDIVRGPDFAFVAAARTLPYDDQDRYFEGAPDLVVEIVSPNDMAIEVRERIDHYFTAGCRLIWIIHPLFKTIEVHRPNNTVSVLRENDILDGEAVISGLRIPVADLFS